MRRSFLFLMVSFFFLSLFSVPVHADMGPKPSVTISVVNAPDGEFYMTLLSEKETYGPWSKVEGDPSSVPKDDRDKAFAFFADYEDRDGFCFQGNLSEAMSEGDDFKWSYYPPERFKVAIYVPKDGSFYLSEVIERQAFNSYFVADCSTRPMVVREEAKIKDQVLGFVCRVLFTIAIEMLLGLLMGYRKKKELILILVVNIITQVILNGLFALFDYYGGMLTWLFLLPVGELIVIVIEEIIYLIGMKGHGKWKTFFYALLANLLSAAATFMGLVALNIA